MKERFTVAIHPDVWPISGHQLYSFSDRWMALLEREGHHPRLVDASAPDFFDSLVGSDGLMWWFPPIAPHVQAAKRLMAALDHGARRPLVYPNWRSCWHFDDKIAQAYLLRAAGIPAPRTWVFWEYEAAMSFCRTATYPLVIKLSSGFRSNHVRLLQDAREAATWVNRLFGGGVYCLDSVPGPRLPRLRRRLRRAARRFLSGSPAGDARELHRNYLFVQEFLPGNDADTRVMVIGRRAFALRRLNRPNDFRASGSGHFDFDPSKVDLDAVRLALRVAGHLRTQCLAVDMLRQNGQPKVIEMSYFFGWADDSCPGYWTLCDSSELRWVAEPVQPEALMLSDFLAHLRTEHSLSS